MSFIEWDDSFSVKISKIDAQHKKLFSMINNLHDAINEGRGKEAENTIIRDMVAYAAIHFKTEEDEMFRHKFPEFDSHKKEHNAFTKKALELQSQLLCDEAPSPEDTLNFLKDWLQHHILEIDQQYVDFFTKAGVS